MPTVRPRSGRVGDSRRCPGAAAAGFFASCCLSVMTFLRGVGVVVALPGSFNSAFEIGVAGFEPRGLLLPDSATFVLRYVIGRQTRPRTSMSVADKLRLQGRNRDRASARHGAGRIAKRGIGLLDEFSAAASRGAVGPLDLDLRRSVRQATKRTALAGASQAAPAVNWSFFCHSLRLS